MANLHGTNERRVRRILRDHGVERRRTGPPEHDVSTELIIELHDEEGLDWQAIADQTGLARSAVRKRYIKAVLPRRQWPRWVVQG